MNKLTIDTPKVVMQRIFSSPHAVQFFEEKLKEVFGMEKALTKIFPKMIQNASTLELINVLISHLTETEERVFCMEALFKSIKKKSIGKKCVALDLIMEEAYESIASSDDCMIRDAEIISALQKLNYYEIEACNKASQFAEALGYNEAVRMLQISQQEESAIDNRIGQIVLNTINVAVMEEVLSFD